jgi:hypothetical protein
MCITPTRNWITEWWQWVLHRCTLQTLKSAARLDNTGRICLCRHSINLITSLGESRNQTKPTCTPGLNKIGNTLLIAKWRSLCICKGLDDGPLCRKRMSKSSRWDSRPNWSKLTNGYLNWFKCTCQYLVKAVKCAGYHIRGTSRTPTKHFSRRKSAFTHAWYFTDDTRLSQPHIYMLIPTYSKLRLGRGYKNIVLPAGMGGC